ncbi:MAG: hypothetical protein A3F82_02190 [Deltaproteobacteria bacterium RIFCSPLOWO2_12_FULL_44_12]|nr:MAG: hypothetical protein A2712_02765 [Deltaproteobacteria bacterium RIFCSPHIGHO2_01_FULL_43_49]OGQ16117.1 MAG: hypothetical protein A3D22_00735 [Deltaproteobacteria bacterium RIFCSPHIGHO2_02_FULL_44_53]OGQ29078.1 MAG: hypothetical protein A3D98_04520 [Deltaproteobacteria bacterium RIFCSPHIGHO2_12_FULL_44_21]OGQ32634.1 MAG: hypothetical protein A2979_08665 [Deltaproteobacteria bacterium RIFCSPLOWO2_01_FULL_45_74]OGQ41735.1 MAG: hypothetical protein A3I70_08450 [Deltaproteobacteria bacterium 
MNKLFFVEKITVLNWLVSVLPYIVKDRGAYLYFIDASWFGFYWAKLTATLFDIHLEKLNFHLVDIKDERGLLLRLRIASQDLQDLKKKILETKTFQNIVQKFPHKDFSFYLKKGITLVGYDWKALWRALLVVQIANWKRRQSHAEAKKCLLFLKVRPWMDSIKHYGNDQGIDVMPLLALPGWDLRKSLVADVYRKARIVLWHLKKRSFLKKKSSQKPEQKNTPKVVLECHYHLNLNRPEIFSELFFWQESDLRGQDVLITFHIQKEPLDAKKWSELRAHGMSAVTLDPRASQIVDCPPFLPPLFSRNGIKREQIVKKTGVKGYEKKWFRTEMVQYQATKSYWMNFFEKTNGKIFVTWFRYDGRHCVIHDAIQSCGGVMAIYQRALDTTPTPDIAIQTDLCFGYSQFAAQIEKDSESSIPYFVITGYLGDHRMALLRSKARSVREQLQKSGARKIIAFADENSGDDARWHTGHEFMRVNYEFLLDKILSDSSLGLILKPKVPSTLRRRLGSVTELLEKTEKTGRCYIYEEGAAHGHYPPAIAALSADVAIHGHLCAATAGLDFALTGVPTLLMDREGWSVSPLYHLGVGQVVFNDWPLLWKTLQGHWKNPTGVPGFGDWSRMLKQLDPFRDGKAAYRMGTYIRWMIEDFKSGLSREIVLANAAQRYCDQWGSDKVLSING